MSDFDEKTWQDLPLTPNTGETVDDWFARIATWAAANPSLSTPLTAAALNDFEARIAAAIPTVVTTLPGSPSDGQEVYYLAGTGDTARLWHLRYDSSITDAYKWRVIAAQPLRTYLSTVEARATLNAWGLLPTDDAIALPLKGIWVLDGSVGFTSGTTAGSSWMSFGTAAGAQIGTEDRGGALPINASSTLQFLQTLEFSTAQTVKLVYYQTAATGRFQRRVFSATPVRVG